MRDLGPFEEQPFLAVAVSGGADSLALTLLADRWARERGGRIVGLTVDHGLRPDSLDEARKTGLWLNAHQIDHHILPWIGEKPVTGLQQRARDARYALLTDWCRHHHCLHLLTAHHRRDQAETVAIRKARQSGKAGLAAMAAVRDMQGLRLLRPLLGIDKESLEGHLQSMHQLWINDPSNDSLHFTRNRLRRSKLDVQALVEEAEREGMRRRDADRHAAAALVQHAALDPAGFATLDAAGFNDLPPNLALDLLTRLLMTIGGNIYPPRRQALARLFSMMRDDTPKDRRSTSSGTLAQCRVLPHRGRWLICREHAASTVLSLRLNRRQRWDNRFLMTLRKPWHQLKVKALGENTCISDNALVLKGKNRHLAGAVKASLPAIWQDDKLIAIPHLCLYKASFQPPDIYLRFCPTSPLANATFKPHISGR